MTTNFKLVIMDTSIHVSEIFKTSWGYTKSQIWILAGLVIGFMLIAFTVGIFVMSMQSSSGGTAISYLISALLSAIFYVGYIKNTFQTMEGDEPQFSAYLQSGRKIMNYFLANILFGVIVGIGTLLFVLPGIYLGIRLQFFGQCIVEEDAGAVQALKQSWALTKGQFLPLLLLLLAQILIAIIGLILFGIGIFVAIPLIVMMQSYTYRLLGNPKLYEEVQI